MSNVSTHTDEKPNGRNNFNETTKKEYTQARIKASSIVTDSPIEDKYIEKHVAGTPIPIKRDMECSSGCNVYHHWRVFHQDYVTDLFRKFTVHFTLPSYKLHYFYKIYTIFLHTIVNRYIRIHMHI